jgi:hypothetical protein
MSRATLILAASVAAMALSSAAFGADACPKLSVLADATRVTSFENTRVIQYRATISGEALQCVVDDDVAHTRLKFKVAGTLAASAKASARKVDYFVAVLDGETVLAKQVYSLTLPFNAKTRAVEVEEKIKRVDIPVADGKSADDYHVLIGFQLTREQLAYNRKPGSR